MLHCVGVYQNHNNAAYGEHRSLSLDAICFVSVRIVCILKETYKMY